MRTEDKISAPRIVQPRPWRVVFLLAAALIGMGVTAYYGFEFGRQQVRDNESAPTDEADYLRERIAELEIQNAELLSRVHARTPLQSEQPPAEEEPSRVEVAESDTPMATRPEMEQSGEQMQPSPEAPEAVADSPEVPQTETVAVAPATRADDIDNSLEAPAEIYPLEIQDFRLRSLATSNSVRFSFSVALANGGAGTVTGSIWIAIDGRSDGKPAQLRLAEVSADQSNFVRMRFKQRQLVEGDMILPEGFTPRKVVVEAKPLEKERYKAVAGTFDWILSGN